MAKEFYVKITGDKDEIQDLLLSISWDNQFNSNISIGELVEDSIDVIVDEWTDGFEEYQSLQPLFSKVSKEEIKDTIYTNIINHRYEVFNNLIELRKEKVGI